MSILNTRFKRCAQVIATRRSAWVWSCLSFGTLAFLPLPRFAGVTIARYLLLGAPKVGALGEHSMKSGQVNPGFGYQGDQPGNEIQRFEYDMSGAVGMLTSHTDASNQAPQYIQQRSRGTDIAPEATGDGDLLGLISFRGHTGFDFTATKAAITVKTTEAWSETGNGTQIKFATKESGTTKLSTVMEITHDGKVKIKGKELNVPDYVFEPDYALMSLDELASYIKTNKHLPGVASASEVHSEGLDLAGSQLSVLEKVEELTLYTLQQHEALKAMDSLKSENAALRERLAVLERQQADIQTVMARLIENQATEEILTNTSIH